MLNDLDAEDVTLGEGVPRHIINHQALLKSSSGDGSDEFIKPLGYVFPLVKGNESYGVVFTNTTEIERATDDFSFTSDLEKAKAIIGYDKDSKLIHDHSLHLVALISYVEGKEVVVPLRKNTLLFPDLKPFTEYNIEEFREMLLANAQEIEADKATQDPNEPRSGGSGGELGIVPKATSHDSSTQSTIDISTVLTWLLSGLIVCGATGYIFFRNKNHTNSK